MSDQQTALRDMTARRDRLAEKVGPLARELAEALDRNRAAAERIARLIELVNEVEGGIIPGSADDVDAWEARRAALTATGGNP